MKDNLSVLIIEDDEKLCGILMYQFLNKKITPHICRDGAEGFAEAVKGYDIILLDLMIPKMDGLDMLQRLRQKNIKTPVIIVSAICDCKKRIEGLDYGADDYITKPFEFNELMARINAVIRRTGYSKSVMEYGDIVFNPYSAELSCRGRLVSLMPKEGLLLERMLQSPENMVSRDDMLRYVWGEDSFNDDGNLDNYIYFLRNRLRRAGSRVQIKNIRGKGYTLCLNDAG